MANDLFEEMAFSITEGDPEAAGALAKRAIAEGVDPLEAINKGFVVGMKQVGKSFGCGEAYLPDLVLAGEAMKAAVAVLDPELARRGQQRETAGDVVHRHGQGRHPRHRQDAGRDDACGQRLPGA